MTAEVLTNRATAVSSGRPHSKRLDIQGLRAVAVLLVVIEHARWGLTGGFTGVDIFFVISGFVITLSILRDVESTGSVKFGSFYKKRIFRLMPAASVVTLVTAVVAIVLVSPLGLQQQAAATGGAALVWLSNIVLYILSSDYFSPHVQANPFLHTWSLGVEEQFYLVFPLVVALGWTAGRKLGVKPRSMLIVFASVIGVMSFALSLATSMGETFGAIGNPARFAFYMMPTRAWEFAVGVLLALSLTRSKKATAMSVPVASAAASIGLVLIGVGAVFITQEMHFPGYAALLPVAGAGLLILGGARSNPLSSALSWAPLTWVGDRTYSLYLWHWPMIVFARRIWPDSDVAIIGAVIAALLLADLTFRFVEEPLKGLGRKPLWRRTSLGPLAIYGIAGTACMALLAGSLMSWNNPRLEEVAGQLNERPIGYRECLSVTPVSQRDLEPCTWGADRDGQPIYLMGDSNAQQYTEALIGASETIGRPLIVATWGGCQFFDAERHNVKDPTQQQECLTYVEDGTEWLVNQPAGTVLMANSGTAINDDNIILAGETEVNAKSDVWEEALRDQILSLQSAGHDISLIAMIPHFPDPLREWWHPADCSNSELIDNAESCSASLTESEVAQQRMMTMKAESNAARATGANVIDPADHICEEGCSTFRDGVWVYRDGLHISPEQSRQMAEFYSKALSG